MSAFKNFKTNKYWSQSPDKIAQKFYTTLCLYTSASLDFGVGIDLKDRDILNWSVTASYYSILHSARMIVFAAVGDYMMNHTKISDFFSPNNPVNRENKYYTNWLKKFKKDFDKHIDGEKAEFTLDEFCNYYKDELYLEEPFETFRCIGYILRNAKDLRNNTNYEPLLIAHEYKHIKVTNSFKELSELMSNGAEKCLKCATKCLKSHLESDTEPFERKNDLKYFIKEHIKNRIYSPIENKIRNSFVLEKIKDCIKPLYRICLERDKSTLKFFEIIKQVSMEMFSAKTELMRSFDNKIEELRENIGSEECKIIEKIYQ